MTEAFVRLISKAVLLLVTVACAWWAGHEHAHRAQEARQAQVARETALAIDQEWERGNQAAQTLRIELTALHARYNQLEGIYREYKRTHSLLARPCSGAGADHAVSAMVADLVPTGKAPPASLPAHGRRGDDPALTVGAVWLWNEALAPDHALEGACGAAGASAAGCAAASRITLGDAWENHRLNAQICANNRLAHQRLIDYIQKSLGTHGHE